MPGEWRDTEIVLPREWSAGREMWNCFTGARIMGGGASEVFRDFPVALLIAEQ
jgi:maltooligosyltrehalose synthase